VWPVQLKLTLLSLAATWFVRPSIKANYLAHPIGFLIPLVVFASLILMLFWTRGRAQTEMASTERAAA
jgi:hypothetical protein